MLKLLKMDFKLLLSDRYSLVRSMLFIAALFVFAIELGSKSLMDVVLAYMPIMIILSNLVVANIKEDLVKNYSMIQSLPVKRWEYVISNYIATLLKHGILIIYLVLVLRLLNNLGFSSLDYIRIILSKKTFGMWLVTYAIIIPISFIFFGVGRNVLSFLTANLMQMDYKYGEVGVLSFLVNLGNIKFIYIILLMLAVSMGMSILVYSKRDLR